MPAVQGFQIIFIKFGETEIIGILTMAKWINGNTTEIGTFCTGKRGNKFNESNQNIRFFTKKKDVLPVPIFVDQDITQRGKY